MNNEVKENTQVENQVQDDIKVVETAKGNIDGQNKCEKCGATDISVNPRTGMLRCNYCRHEFQSGKIEGIEEDVSKLEGVVMGSGATNIVADANDIITLKCSSCGAEVVIDTSEQAQARCHWCRNTLSINNQIPNGSIPDMVLPFKLTKKEAEEAIRTFVKKRNFFALPKFKEEFTTENIMGVYLPYMLVDINGHSNLKGEGEVLVRSYTVGSDENKKTYYDADAYHVERDFDIQINDLTIESSKDKLERNNNKTNNIINAIMPFDTNNCLKWDANYLKGYSSEKRDVNVEELKGQMVAQAKDVARYQANKSLTQYNRGVRWEMEQLEIKGQQWAAAYLPVWLYSYQETKGKKSLLHYVAVNARTKETMGSVPINMTKLWIFTIILEILGFLGMTWIISSAGTFEDNEISLALLLPGVIFYIYNYARYRNQNARHTHEKETETKTENLKKVDNYIGRRTKLSNSRITGANNTSVSNGGLDSITNLVNKIK